jgi:hypothetical protein
MVIAFDDETVVAVLRRIRINETTSPCLVVIPHENEPFGHRFLIVTAAPLRRSWHSRKVERVPLAREASIGMLYDALTGCAEYLPGEWTRPVVFERVPTPA